MSNFQNERSRQFLNSVLAHHAQSNVTSQASLRQPQQHPMKPQPNTYRGPNKPYPQEMSKHDDCLHHLHNQASHGGGDYLHYADQMQVERQDSFDEEEEIMACQHSRMNPAQVEYKKQIKSDETYSQKSSISDRSDSTRQTALRNPLKNGRQLKELVSSKVSLQKTIDDSITGVDKQRNGYCCCTKPTTTLPKLPQNNQKKIPNVASTVVPCDSEEFNSCTTSPSAELINEKIIHPMVKKFRLMYLHNIREEVGIMENLEKLPNKVTKFCKEIEKDLLKN